MLTKTFVVAHWGLTILLAPFTSQVLQYAFTPNAHQIVGLLEVYPITLAFSIAFSLPTFLIYLTCFYFLSKKDTSPIIAKYLLIGIAVAGVYVTMTIIKGSMSQDITIAYSLTALLVGLILKLKRKESGTDKEVFSA